DGGRGPTPRGLVADELHLRVERVARAGGPAPVAVAGDGHHRPGGPTLRVAVGDATTRVDAGGIAQRADAVDGRAHGAGGRRGAGEVAEKADTDVAVVESAHVATGDDRGSDP